MKKNTCLSLCSKKILLSFTFILAYCATSVASDNLFEQARMLQREGKYDEAIEAYKNYLLQPINEDEFTKQQMVVYTDALVQLMNTYQSKGEPEACITTFQELFNESPILQKQWLRDYYSVMGYALSRTERMKEAEETTMRVFSIPLRHATP